VLYRLRRGAGRHLPIVVPAGPADSPAAVQSSAVDDQRLQDELDAEAGNSDDDD
jgi:hypothetical protein